MKNTSLLLLCLILLFGCKKDKGPDGSCAPSFGIYDGCPLQRPIDVMITVTCSDCSFKVSDGNAWIPYSVKGAKTVVAKESATGFYGISYIMSPNSKGIKIEYSKEKKTPYIISNESLVESDGEKRFGLNPSYFDNQK